MRANRWTDSVVYQVYPRSFADHNGDGMGDLAGIKAHIPYIAQLGADVLWLSPVYRSPQDDNGYDISDYYDIDPMFGRLSDFDDLVATARDHGISVIMDLVVNHTSDEHAWFQESRDPASDKRDWYIWRPAREGHEPGTPGAEPTNWGSFFGGSGWEYDELSGEYYLHLFSRKQPDLNWENPRVRQAIYEMMRWWIDRGVAGFRMDVINLISKRYPLGDGVVEPGFPYSTEVALVVDGPRMIEFIEEMNQEVGIDAQQLFTVGEMVLATPESAREYTTESHPRLGMIFTFEHMELDHADHHSKLDLVPLHLPDLKKNLARWQYELADEGWNSLYWCNHDQPRIVSRYGDDSPEHRVASAKTLATVLHMHRGTPYVYQGEEIGMTNAGFTSLEQYHDIESIGMARQAIEMGVPESDVVAALAAISRDNARTPMQWSSGPNAGFTTGVPWIPINPNHNEINVADAMSDPGSVFHHYRKLIALRHNSEIVARGEFELLLPDDERFWVFTRNLGSEWWLVVANMRSQLHTLPMQELPSIEGAEVLLGTHGTSGSDVATLRPWESRIYRLA